VSERYPLLLSIDPALHGCGCALWDSGTLKAAGYAASAIGRSTDVETVARAVQSAFAAHQWAMKIGPHCYDQLVFELPQIYQRGANKSKGDPNKNVLPLAMVGAALAMQSFAQVSTYQPHTWKGTTQKPKSVREEVVEGKVYVIKTRVKERLLDVEKAVVDWTGSVEHSWDVADAIAIGLHHLDRFERKRVFARE
jgi:Holliday junction resolvasome RuvABC endonuclease subunit